MGLVVKVWVDGNPDSDSPLINLSGDSDSIKTAAKKAESGEESCEIICATVREAAHLLAVHGQNQKAALEKTEKIASLNAEVSALNAISPATVASDKITALKA